MSGEPFTPSGITPPGDARPPVPPLTGVAPTAELQQSPVEPMHPVLEKMLTRARTEIDAHAEDFLAVGVAQGQIDAAIGKAEERARQEYERREQEDPLRQVARVLDGAVQTPEDELIVTNIKGDMETARVQWREGFDFAKKVFRPEGKGDPSPADIVQHLYRNNLAPTFTEHTSDGGRVHISILWGASSTGRGSVDTYPSDALRERVLKGLGVLENDQSLDSLKELPRTQTRSGGEPAFRTTGFGDRGFAENLPTSIPDVQASVAFGSPQGDISLQVPPQKIAQVISYPTK